MKPELRDVEKPLDKLIKSVNDADKVCLHIQYLALVDVVSELAELKNLCSKEQLAELDFILKRQGEKSHV